METAESKPPRERGGKGDNLIQVSNKKDIKFFLFIARQILNNHEDLEITAIGESISNAIIVGETLCRNKQTKWKKITTETIDSKPMEKDFKDQGKYPRNHKKIKVSIKLLKV
jgi:DNA-binding protein